MLDRISEFVRSLVRPLITVGIVGALIVAAFENKEAFDLLIEPGLIIVGFWFGQRVGGNGNSGNPDA